MGRWRNPFITAAAVLASIFAAGWAVGQIVTDAVRAVLSNDEDDQP